MFTDMDEEKESLRRQIQLLQGLINSHKTIHGNAPANPRWQPPGQPAATQTSWRKKYSLVNRTSQAAEASGGSCDEDARKSVAPTAPPRKPGKPKLSGIRDQSASTFRWQSAATQESRAEAKPSSNTAVPSTSAPRGARDPGRQTQGAHKEILRGAPKLQQKASLPPLNKTTPAQVPAATQTPLQKAPLSLPRTEVNYSAPKPITGSSHRTLSAPQKSDVPANKTPKSRKTKYIWVADSPKAPPAAKKVSPSAKKTPSDEKQKPPEATAVTKGRKNGASPKAAALRSRYKWKAENLVSTPKGPGTASQIYRGAQGSGPTTPQHSRGPAAMAAAASYTDSAHSSYKVKSKTKIIKRRSTTRSPTDRKASALAPVMVQSHYFLRRRSSPRAKSPSTVKRTSPRGLVHLSKHRLRRLPPTGKQPPPSIQEASSSMKSPISSRVINTRYRIVKRRGTPPLVTSPLSTLSSSLNWRMRLLLLSRLRQNQQRWRSRGLCFIGGVMYRVSANKLSKTWSPGSGSKTTPKTGKLDVSSPSPGSFYPSRSATPSRYIASRAIQRSLAIIRQAQQKKEKKEYCMYYNRFGKCNRGQKCPYIHDPEKVAVCTRFLRGTCKKTDGTCPFSHQMSKDKMPVCSYFLKGICRNNDCPYSHVYVSRKAEVCPDFLKGYCPMGAKCKKKHTLLCPDYARTGKCPQGTKCKLQHRQRKRRLDMTAQQEQTPTGGKQSRRMPDQAGTSSATACARDYTSASDEEHGLPSCPSFISLNCSSASEGTPTSERVKSSENSGKPLQIKPRL